MQRKAKRDENVFWLMLFSVMVSRETFRLPTGTASPYPLAAHPTVRKNLSCLAKEGGTN
jgi:hypothetical protein